MLLKRSGLTMTDPFWGTEYQDYADLFKAFGVEMKNEIGNLKTLRQLFREAAEAARRGGDAE